MAVEATLDIEAAVRSFLLARPAIAGLVGQRITPDALPELCELPAIATVEVDGEDFPEVAGTAEIYTMRLSIQCAAADVGLARRLRNLVRIALRAIPRQTIGTIFINGVTVGPPAAEYEPPTDGSDEGRYWRAIDAELTYSPAP